MCVTVFSAAQALQSSEGWGTVTVRGKSIVYFLFLMNVWSLSRRSLKSLCWSLSCSLDVSLLSPDSSYICYTSAHGSEPCCCRRSPRLLTNGYYDVTEDSFSWDDEGNVSLTPCKTSVSYKENLHRWERQVDPEAPIYLDCFYLRSGCRKNFVSVSSLVPRLCTSKSCDFYFESELSQFPVCVTLLEVLPTLSS